MNPKGDISLAEYSLIRNSRASNNDLGHVCLQDDSFLSWLVYKKKKWLLYFDRSEQDVSATSLTPSPRFVSGTITSVIKVLSESAVFISIKRGNDFDEDQMVYLQSTDLWSEVLSESRENVRMCLAERESQQKARNAKLIKLDIDIMKNFSSGTKIVLRNKQFSGGVVYLNSVLSSSRYHVKSITRQNQLQI